MTACKSCGKPGTGKGPTGNCRRCALAASNANPVTRERKAEANRRKAREPAFRAKLKARIAGAGRAARTSPEFIAMLRENGLKNIAGCWTPEARAKWLAGRKEAGRKRSATTMSWCPPDRVEEYRYLTRRKGLLAAEARRVILDSLTPFERQMQRVREGASLSIVRPIPRPDPLFTLGGVSEI